MMDHLRMKFLTSAFVLTLLLGINTGALAQFNAFKDPVSGGSSSGVASGPDLKAAQDAIQGGKITVGATAYVVAIFKNNGTSPVTVTGTNLYPSSTVSANVSLNKCTEAPLPPEGECAVTVAITGLQLGSWRVEILMDHDGRTRLAAAAITGDIEGTPEKQDDKVKADIEAVPEMLDFGTSKGGVPLVRSILLRNRTSDEVSLKDIKLEAPEQTGFMSRSECPATLKPSESCRVSVTWNPITRGVAEGVLSITHTAKSLLTQVAVKGDFEPGTTANAGIYPDTAPDSGLLVSDKDKFEFGSGIKGVSAMTASLVNAGVADLTLKTIRLSGSDNGLSVARSGCHSGLVLKPTDACALTINWVPSREGSVIDDLQITHSGARGVLVLPIRGTADAPASRESLAVRQPDLTMSTSDRKGKKDISDSGDIVPVTPVLDGYVVTSLSQTKAVINGPVGSLVVRDGEDVVISGVKWTVTTISTGVILTSNDDEVLLVFDRSLKPKSGSGSSSASTSSSATSSSNTAAAKASSATTSTSVSKASTATSK